VVGAYAAEIADEARAAVQQQATLSAELSRLVATLLVPLEESACDAVPRLATQLENTFDCIDALNARLDGVNADIMSVHAACRALLDGKRPPAMPASSSSASGGAGAFLQRVAATASPADVWAAVPTEAMGAVHYSVPGAAAGRDGSALLESLRQGLGAACIESRTLQALCTPPGPEGVAP
jgi:hypothetical protein